MLNRLSDNYSINDKAPQLGVLSTEHPTKIRHTIRLRNHQQPENASQGEALNIALFQGIIPSRTFKQCLPSSHLAKGSNLPRAARKAVFAFPERPYSRPCSFFI
ncbi:MAG: hypothetical protein GKR94_10290 [Gammaproteobacteria bacterium]|nr:hypothetical protein [Gammaproteobacteria bacterium]